MDDVSLNDRDSWLTYILFGVLGLPYIELTVRKRFYKFYEYSVRLDKYGWVAWGGEKQAGTILIDLNATGCAQVSDWSRVEEWGKRYKARITRCDLAHDDLKGESVNYDKFKQWYYDGLFNTNGRPPEPSEIGHLTPHKGRTFYVGNRKSIKMVRGYEKGKQLKEPESPWFRIEVEFKSGHRELPWDMLSSPTKYFIGAYPCLGFLSEVQERIKTLKAAAALTYRQMLANLKKQAGRAINYLMMVENGDYCRVVDLIRRDGIPESMGIYDGYWFPDDDPGDFVTSESTDKEEVPLYRADFANPDFFEYFHLFGGNEQGVCPA